jgi:hypothetical protein
VFGRKRRKTQADKVLDQIQKDIEHASAQLGNLAAWAMTASSKPAIPKATIEAEREQLLSDVSRLRDELEVDNYLAGRPQAW